MDEIKIGSTTYRMGEYTIGVMLDLEAWAQHQVVEAAKLIVSEDDPARVAIMAEAARRAAATGFFSPEGFMIRSSIRGKLYDLFLRCRIHSPRLSWAEFEGQIRKNPDDFAVAMEMYNRANEPKKPVPPAPKTEAATDQTP